MRVNAYYDTFKTEGQEDRQQGKETRTERPRNIEAERHRFTETAAARAPESCTEVS